MITNRKLPHDFLLRLKALERSYLAETDPIRQSGFAGGVNRWRAEREPILDAILTDGDLLDVGCANGYLLDCLVRWGGERALELTPYGLDCGAGLIALAKRRFPQYRDNFHIGNAWDWMPTRKFHYVYSLYDCVPPPFLEEYVHRLLSRMVAPGGRLIIGAYGSLSRGEAPFALRDFLESKNLAIAGTTAGGNPPIAAFAWLDLPRVGQNHL
ncbi:MAG: class I SAM-dependent methyltransferase [Candidatus Zixiibacteriota bacterium]|nr:MAG: class I SAM-dependent methyltransferase [candidate division Zixibacteria bacterium]